MNKNISSIYLNKEKHLPPIDNQGKVNSCLSQAFVYTQMTSSVSRKMNSASWNPSQMPSACFSPRFTYLLARSGPSDIYGFLKDHGCLTLDRCAFYKDSIGRSLEFDGDIPIKQSVAWNVAPGEFKTALQYRVTGFTKASIHDHKPKELIALIKTNLQEGNTVISTTKIENWLQTELNRDCGTYGKKGDTVIVASRRYIPGGHSFAIVGYDDNIEATFSGITFKGAFLVTCGYGSIWMNGGYCWMMYDSAFETSEYDTMNGTDIYMSDLFLTSYYGNLRAFAPVHLSDRVKEVQSFLFTPVGKMEIDGIVYPTYTIQNPISQKTLRLLPEEDSRNTKAAFSGEGFAEEEWCIVSYRDLAKWKNFASAYDKNYENCYWIFAARAFRENSRSYCFLDSGIRYYDIGRKIGISTLNGGKYPQAKSWIIENYAFDQPFISSLGIYTRDEKIPKKRTYSLREFWFVDWKKDIAVGLPQRMVDIELETADREGFEVKLLRIDHKGKVSSYVPAMFRLPHTQYVKENEIMSFSGEINAKKPEVGYFTFQYSELLSLPEKMNLEDYKWGVEIRSKNDHPIIIKKVSLVNDKNEILSSVSPEPIPLCNASAVFTFEI